MSGGLRLLKTCSPRRKLANSIKIAARPTCHRTMAMASFSRASDMRNRAPHEGMRFTRREQSDSDLSALSNHMNKTFAPLHFPDELAIRLLTHSSHSSSTLQGHNGRLAFSGRRVLESYFLLFVHSCPEVRPTDDYEKLAERALDTYLLGEHVAPNWSIGHVLRWKPVAEASPGKYSVGLHKILGTTVEAIMGGIYHQFGASVAHQIFHTRVLPHLLLKGSAKGVQDNFHDHALQIYRRMGGKPENLRL